MPGFAWSRSGLLFLFLFLFLFYQDKRVPRDRFGGEKRRVDGCERGAGRRKVERSS